MPPRRAQSRCIQKAPELNSTAVHSPCIHSPRSAPRNLFRLMCLPRSRVPISPAKLYLLCSPPVPWLLSPSSPWGKVGTHRRTAHHPLQGAGSDHSPTALRHGEEAGTTAGMQGCSSLPRRGCGLGCPARKHQEQKLSGPQFLRTRPCGDAWHTHAHPAAPRELLKALV